MLKVEVWLSCKLRWAVALTCVVPSSQYLETDVLPQVTWTACIITHRNDCYHNVNICFLILVVTYELQFFYLFIILIFLK